MAEGRTITPENVVCRFFATTSCHDGDKCLFSHDISRPKLDTVCRFYLQGRCLFGNSCKYDHARLKSAGHNKNSTLKCPTSAQLRNSTINAKNTSLSKANLSHRQCDSNRSIKSEKSYGSSDWVNAPEFVPRTQRKSYADTVKSGEIILPSKSESSEEYLCPHHMVGDCPLGERCPLIHGTMCDICGKACLLPFDKEQQRKHQEECEKELEKDMELSFAIQRSVDKSCGICMDIIMEKEQVSERRFGILEKCNHVFCLSCIRTWRKVKRENSQVDPVVDPTVTRACPECRVPSDFVTPSQYWIDNEEEKNKLITSYKEALSKKPCMHFQQGRGICPFGGACFYLHAYPDGRKVDLPPPRRRRRQNQNGDTDVIDHVFLWEFLESRYDNSDGFNYVDWDDLVFEHYQSDGDSSDISVPFPLYDD